MNLGCRLLVILLFSLAMSPRAHAADIDFPSANAVVTRYGKTTYLDLARHFVADIKPTDNGYVGTSRIPLRHLGGKDFEGLSATTYGFFDISVVRMTDDGKARLLVLFDFAQASPDADKGSAVLALYDVKQEPVLLDAADIAFDQSTYFFDQALLPISATSVAILVMSTDIGAERSFTTQSMILVRGDRLELIDRVLLLSEETCAFKRLQDIRYTANPAAAKPYAPIAMIVTETVTPTDRTCNDADKRPQPQDREFRVTYSWDRGAARYVADSDVVARLAEANGKMP